MKKILLILLVMITSLVYSDNLDKYESKRVFDKNMRALKSGYSKEYFEDKDLHRILKVDVFEVKEYRKFLDEISWVFKDYQYEVLDVLENKESSLIKIKAKYKVYDVSRKEFEEVLLQSLEKLNNGMEINNVRDQIEKLTLDEYSELYKLLHEKLKNKIIFKEEVLVVEMNKYNALWDISMYNINYQKYHISTHYLDGMIAIVAGIWNEI